MLLFFLEDLAAASGSLVAGAGTLVHGALHAPVEHVVVLVTLADEQVAEELAEVRVVGLVVETERPGVVQEDTELVGETAAQQVGGRGHLLLHDPVVLLLLRRSLESLPRERATEEVHENVSERLEIIPTSLLNAQMGVDRRVTGGSCQVLVLPVRDVEMGLGVAVLLRKAKIDDIDLVSALANTHKEVVGLDIAVNEVARVDVLDAGDLRDVAY